MYTNLAQVLANRGTHGKCTSSLVIQDYYLLQEYFDYSEVYQYGPKFGFSSPDHQTCEVSINGKMCDSFVICDLFNYKLGSQTAVPVTSQSS